MPATRWSSSTTIPSAAILRTSRRRRGSASSICCAPGSSRRAATDRRSLSTPIRASSTRPRQIELGQFLNPGAPVVSLTDLDTLYANFTLPEQDRARLSVGQDIVIVVDAYRDRKFPAKLTTIEPQVGTDTRTIKLQATLANPEHLLMPGMYAHVHVVLPSLPDVVTVPETAVEYTLYGDSVFVVTEDSAAAPVPAAGQTASPAQGGPALKVKRTFVKTGDRFDNMVAILEGLKPGDRVATSGQIKLTDGAAVTITSSDALATPAAVPTN